MTTTPTPETGIDREAVEKLAALSAIEVHEDFAAMDYRADIPEDLPDGVTAITSAPSVRGPQYEAKPAGYEMKYIEEVDQANVEGLKRKSLGRVAIDHDSVMKSTRAHDLVPNSLEARRKSALNRLRDEHGGKPYKTHGTVDVDLRAKVAPRIFTQRDIDPRSLGVTSHIKPKI